MKVDFLLLFQETGIFRTRTFVVSCDFSLRYFRHMASVVFSFVICSCSNAVTFSNCFSNFVNVSVDFFVLEFRCAAGSRKYEIAFSSAVVDSINFSSFQRHWDVAAPLLPRERPPTKIAMALQRAVTLQRAPLQVASGCRCSVAQTRSD